MARYGWRLTAGKATLEVRFNDTLMMSCNATGLGFYTVAPVARPSAYTQTFSTADKTIAAATVGADIGAFTDPPSAAEMALLRTFVNALKADLADRGQGLNAVIDDLQALGLAQ